MLGLICLIKYFVLIFWILDITNMPFMEIFDTTYPLNGLFWTLIWIFVLLGGFNENEKNPEKSERGH